MFGEFISGLGGILGAALAWIITLCIAIGVAVAVLLFALFPFVFLIRPRKPATPEAGR
ncbi:MAG: hypothetical protein H6840_09825 [Planctomycetes bacterium]|nr:hypothetical protein [Planctomycetota bacterium]